MKLTKKLLPALGMLALSACMLVTSTFAWFSMNTKASVTGMQVTAVTDQVFLQITTKDGAFLDGQIQDTIADEPAHTGKYGAVNVYADDTGSPYAGGDTFKWLTASSEDPDEPTATTEFSPVDSGDYSYSKEYDLRYDPKAGANATAGALRVEKVLLTSNDTYALSKAVSVLVVCEDENLSQLWKQEGGVFKKVSGSDDALTAGVFPAGGTVVTVKVYVFFDGENENCTTTNAITATDIPFAVSIHFTTAS